MSTSIKSLNMAGQLNTIKVIIWVLNGCHLSILEEDDIDEGSSARGLEDEDIVV